MRGIHQWPVIVFIHLRLNKWLSKQSRHRWLETPSHLLWRLCNGYIIISKHINCSWHFINKDWLHPPSDSGVWPVKKIKTTPELLQILKPTQSYSICENGIHMLCNIYHYYLPINPRKKNSSEEQCSQRTVCSRWNRVAKLQTWHYGYTAVRPRDTFTNMD